MTDASGEPDLDPPPGTLPGTERIAYVVVHREDVAFSDVYGGGGSMIALDCHLIRPVGRPSRRVLVFMHPTGGGMYLPIVAALAAAGHHVIWANSRYRGTDAALIMEEVVADLGVTIRDATDRLGYDEVVLAGWSGGGSLSAYYQSVANRGEGIADTPAGDPYTVAADRLPPADAVLLMAAHASRHGTLTEWLDPSIGDESRPFDRSPALNLYDPSNPNQPPYSDDYLAEYRGAQRARNRRITLGVRDQLERLVASGRPHDERAFCVHGTMADPRWLDPTIDPSDREPGTCYLGDPQIVNDGPVGLARFSTLRSWLSQWSLDDARGDASQCVPHISEPILVIGNTADDACTPSHTSRIYHAIDHDRKRLHEIQGATHYYLGPRGRQHLTEAVTVVGEFLDAELGTA